MQRQLRLGDILDDYCPRERRLTNHAVVAMVGDEVKQTRCTTCDAEHEYKHAKIPRQRRKDAPAGLPLPPQAVAAVPKRVVPDAPAPKALELSGDESVANVSAIRPLAAVGTFDEADVLLPLDAIDPVESDGVDDNTDAVEAGPAEADGPAHRRLIRATLPRTEGQPPPSRPAPDFTIRTPAAGRPNRFRPRNQPRTGQPFQNNRSGQPGGAGGPARSGMPRNGNSRAPLSSRPARRHDGGRKRSK